jgi:murein L,D-transpeptidase YafK
LPHRERARARRRWFGCAATLLLCLFWAPAQATEAVPIRADRILVLKSDRVLMLLRHGRVLRVFPIALGPHPNGTKRARGDGRTPEGTYVIDGRLVNSAYHLALHISYPSDAQRAQSIAAHTDPGGDIFIHGLPNWYQGPKNPSRFYKDWTEGCISVGDKAIEEIWRTVADGTPIEIRP